MGLLLKQNVVIGFYHEEWFQQSLRYVWDYINDKGWPITWPEVSPGAGMEWRGWITVNR